MKNQKIITPNSNGSVPFVPHEQPWQRADFNLPKIDTHLLTSDIWKESFNNHFPWIEDEFVRSWNELNLSKPIASSYIDAAVLIPLLKSPNGVEVIFTKRASHLKKHSGQICFPGGRIEQFDSSITDAALRETEEEIGITKNHIQVFGTMPDFLTGTGFIMKPCVAWIEPDAKLKADENEVEEIFSVPLDYLLNPQNHRVYTVKESSRVIRSYYGFYWKEHFIWGATAAVVRNFYQRLRQRVFPYT